MGPLLLSCLAALSLLASPAAGEADRTVTCSGTVNENLAAGEKLEIISHMGFDESSEYPEGHKCTVNLRVGPSALSWLGCAWIIANIVIDAETQEELRRGDHQLRLC